MAAEEITLRLPGLCCPTCGDPNVALTTLNRVVEWFWGGPVPPYMEHVCVLASAKTIPQPALNDPLEGSEVFDL